MVSQSDVKLGVEDRDQPAMVECAEEAVPDVPAAGKDSFQRIVLHVKELSVQLNLSKNFGKTYSRG